MSQHREMWAGGHDKIAPSVMERNPLAREKSEDAEKVFGMRHCSLLRLLSSHSGKKKESERTKNAFLDHGNV